MVKKKQNKSESVSPTPNENIASMFSPGLFVEEEDIAALQKLDAETLERVVALVEEERTNERLKLEQEKQTLLEALPEAYKARFGEIAYQKWKQDIYPVLILHPYDAPEHVRQTILASLQKGELDADNIPYVIYYYGAQTLQEAHNAYGTDTTLHLMDKDTAQAMASKHKKLKLLSQTPKHKRYQACHQELQQDLKLSPTKRYRRFPNCYEKYDLINIGAFIKYALKNSPRDDQSKGSDTPKTKKGNDKKRGVKRKNKQDHDKCDDNNDGDDDDNNTSITEEPKVTIKGKRRKKVIKTDSSESATMDARAEVEMVLAEDFAERESSDSEEDSDYEGHQQHSKRVEQDTQIQRKTVVAKKSRPSQGTTGKKVVKKEKKKKMTMKDRYLDNKTQFAELEAKWGKALDQLNTTALEECMKIMKKNAQDMSPFFIHDTIIRLLKTISPKNEKSKALLEDETFKNALKSTKDKVSNVYFEFVDNVKNDTHLLLQVDDDTVIELKRRKVAPAQVVESKSDNTDKKDTTVEKIEVVRKYKESLDGKVAESSLAPIGDPSSQPPSSKQSMRPKPRDSFGSLFKKMAAPPTQQSSTVTAPDEKKSAGVDEGVPEWCRSVPEGVETPTAPERLLTYLFFEQTASMIVGKSFDRKAFALQLEHALFVSIGDISDVEKSREYKKKTQLIVGAFAGRNERAKGTLLSMLTGGSFKGGAKPIVELSNENLALAFEGKSLEQG